MCVCITLKARDRRFDGFVVTGGAVGCHYDNLRRRRLRRGCRIDDFLFSVYVCVSAYFLFVLFVSYSRTIVRRASVIC